MVVFADCFNGSELQTGLTAGFRGSHSGAKLLFRLQRQMLLHFFAQPLIAPALGRKVPDTCE